MLVFSKWWNIAPRGRGGGYGAQTAVSMINRGSSAEQTPEAAFRLFNWNLTWPYYKL